jgi:GDPmannose 4,6-dehydratase
VPVALITGITGQDGSYLAERLVDEGWTVHGTVRPGEDLPGYIVSLSAALVLHEVDLLETDRLEQLILDTAPAEIYNLAGVSSVGLSWQQPVLTAQVNAVAISALLDAVQRLQEASGHRVRFLQASSAELFAGATTSPQDERTAIMPRSPYGAAKAHAHHLCQLYRGVDVHASTVVLYNHESPRRPDSFVTRKITKTVAAIADGRADELVLGNLTPRRDWGWAPEYVDAMVRALRHDTPDDFVIATGVGHSVADFVAAAFARVGITDWQPYVRTDAAFSRSIDPVDLVGEASKAAGLLGWRPVVGFAELVGRMVDADRSSRDPTSVPHQAGQDVEGEGAPRRQR